MHTYRSVPPISIDGDKTIKIYCHNVSGCASKLFAMNHKLALSAFDLIMIQETWFSDNTDFTWLTANTSYNIICNHRSFFTRRISKRGGGLALIYCNTLDVKQIELPHTLLEIQAFTVGILDLVFSNSSNGLLVSVVDDIELIDSNALHHVAISLELTVSFTSHDVIQIAPKRSIKLHQSTQDVDSLSLDFF